MYYAFEPPKELMRYDLNNYNVNDENGSFIMVGQWDEGHDEIMFWLHQMFKSNDTFWADEVKSLHKLEKTWHKLPWFKENIEGKACGMQKNGNV